MSKGTHISSDRCSARIGASRGCLELAHREAHGVSVRLYWRPRDDELYVHVQNEREDFVLNPHKREALFAYYHPYAAANRVLKAGRIAA